MKCQHIDEKADIDFAEQGIFPPYCSTPATHRHGRRLYCKPHAPEGSVELDSFVTSSAMTVEDKAAEYDRIAEYLRKQGWSVVRETRVPGGRVRQAWRREDHGENSSYDWVSAYRVECYEDAPKQGERSASMLKGLSDSIDEKNRRRQIIVELHSRAGRITPEVREAMQKEREKYRVAGCTCDAVGEGSCPIHGEEMRAQDERIAQQNLETDKWPTCGYCGKTLGGDRVYCRECFDQEIAFKKVLLGSQVRLAAEIRYLRDAMQGLVSPNGESPVRQEEVDEILARADRIGAGQETFPRPLKGAQALTPEQVDSFAPTLFGSAETEKSCGCTFVGSRRTTMCAEHNEKAAQIIESEEAGVRLRARSRCSKCGCTDGMHYGWCK